jgi:hypothetical protein
MNGLVSYLETGPKPRTSTNFIYLKINSLANLSPDDSPTLAWATGGVFRFFFFVYHGNQEVYVIYVAHK